MIFGFGNEQERAYYETGMYEERLKQIIRLVRAKGNEHIIYTEDLCRLLGIDVPKPPIENGKQQEPSPEI